MLELVTDRSEKMKRDPLKRANLALVIKLVVERTLDGRIHGSDPLGAVLRLVEHAARDEHQKKMHDGSMNR